MPGIICGGIACPPSSFKCSVRTKIDPKDKRMITLTSICMAVDGKSRYTFNKFINYYLCNIQELNW